MSFVKILAPLTGGAQDRIVLASAISAALPAGAHVVGLFVRPDPALAAPFYGEGVSGLVIKEVMDTSRETSDKAADAAQSSVAAIAGEVDVPITAECEKRDTPTVSFKDAVGSFAASIAQAARLSDLVVFAAPKEEERVAVTEAVEATLLEARRPVLLSSRAIAPGFLDRIAIGWNASTECAGAVRAALPFLTRAKGVEVLAIAQPDAPCAQCGEVVEYLSLHGVGASVREIDAGARPVADVLLESAAQAGAGLLVLGGYGHSRWRELFVSGTTSRAIQRADMPLFLVH